MMNKQFLLLTVMLALSGILFAQQNKNSGDTLEINVKKIRTNKTDTVIIESDGQCWKKATKRPNVETGFFNIDLGFSNYMDNTNYSGSNAQAYAPGSASNWFDLKNGKSINVNIWFFSQRVNLIKHVVNLKYKLGLQLNNYRYISPVRYTGKPMSVANPPIVTYDHTASRIYKKDKLAADYISLPIMLNFNLTPNSKYDFGFSGGVSAGYLYSSRNKVVTSDEGKLRERGNFSLNPWRISYVGELNLGVIALYGSLATKSMYKRGLDITPYEIGIRLGAFDSNQSVRISKKKK